MKNDYTIIFIIVDFMLMIVACKKDSNNTLAGKWLENKVRVYQVANTGVILNDTTYMGQTFTNADFVLFNNDGTGTLSVSHVYYPSKNGFTTPTVNPDTVSVNYQGTWPTYILGNTNNPVIPRPATSPTFNSGDTIFVSSPHNLLIRSVFPVYLYNPTKTVFDAYYSK